MRLFKRRTRYFEDLGKVSLRTWREVHETGDLTKLVISGTPEPKKLQEAWHNLNNQFLKVYGLDKNTKQSFKLKYNFARAMVEYLATGEKSYKMELKILREDIELQKKKEGKHVPFIEIIAMVEEVFGFQIDEDKTTVTKFYSYLKQIKHKNEKQQRQIKESRNGKKNI